MEHISQCTAGTLASESWGLSSQGSGDTQLECGCHSGGGLLPEAEWAFLEADGGSHQQGSGKAACVVVRMKAPPGSY